ncbi:MAG: sugar phosphate isomerase/epimerase [Bacteroidota bacterium]
MKRRDFIKTSALATPLWNTHFKLPTQLDVHFFATNWGFEGDIDSFCQKVKSEGYDGIEVWLPKADKRKALLDASQKYELQLGYLIAGSGNQPKAHYATFKQHLDEALAITSQQPTYINCHSGRDFFRFEENTPLIEYTQTKMAQSGVEIFHETHRGRMCFAAHITRNFLERYPEMKLTLDISHWTNVHESMLANQAETVDLALQRVGHIHARVGHPQGPQVNDPRAPEWAAILQQHLDWWDKALQYRAAAGAKRMTILTEFGPPTYLQTLPYTHQPVANQWEINVFMMKLLKERYTG